jgi:hypothetical protein
MHIRANYVLYISAEHGPDIPIGYVLGTDFYTNKIMHTRWAGDLLQSKIRVSIY